MCPGWALYCSGLDVTIASTQIWKSGRRRNANASHAGLGVGKGQSDQGTGTPEHALVHAYPGRLRLFRTESVLLGVVWPWTRCMWDLHHTVSGSGLQIARTCRRDPHARSDEENRMQPAFRSTAGGDACAGNLTR